MLGPVTRGCVLDDTERSGLRLWPTGGSLIGISLLDRLDETSAAGVQRASARRARRTDDELEALFSRASNESPTCAVCGTETRCLRKLKKSLSVENWAGGRLATTCRIHVVYSSINVSRVWL